MISYTFDSSDNIFYVKVEGEISLDEILNFLIDFKKIKNLPLDLKLFYDIRKANFKMGINDIPELAKKTKISTENYRTIKTVFLVDKPRHTALAQVFTASNNEKNSKTKRMFYSTEDAALKWLNSTE